MEEKSEGTGAAKPSRRKTILWASLLGGSALLTLVAARPITAAIQNSAGFHHSWGGRWGGHAMSPEAAKEHLQIASKWMLRDIDASAEQQDRVNAIVAGAVDDLFRLRERHQQNRDAFHRQLGGATIDRAALEEIRKSEMGVADEASKRLVQALADVSDVLTPEQRQALAERIHRHHAN
ncbi:MAG TPA: Spy/CpxP family protein refolding chaperone [Vicinamibacteria bacterium]|nr:Spy/CpxP family protein refolding chaperone [Vicinamibacteria bacterium]